MNNRGAASQFDRQDRRVVAAGLLVAAATAMWLLQHGYHGIVDDSRLYSLQALHRAFPADFAKDVFFLHGSQDDYSIFGPLYGVAVEALGLSTANQVLLVVGQGVWIAAVASLALLLAGPARWLFLGLAFVGSPFYGIGEVLGFGEPFLTARTYAEPLVVGALALALRNRAALAVIALAAAFAVHPLVAAPGAALLFLFHARPSARWVIPALAVVGLVAAAALAEVAPFDRLLATVDPEWAAIVERRSPFLFMANADLGDLNAAVLAAALIVGALAGPLDGRLRRLLAAALIVGIAGYALALLGGDLARNVFVLQIQPWRAWWLTQFFAWMAFAVIATDYRKEPATRVAMAGYFLAWMTVDTVGGAVAVATTVFRYGRVGKGRPAIPRLVEFAMYALTAAAVLARVASDAAGLMPDVPSSLQWLQIAAILAVMILMYLPTVPALAYFYVVDAAFHRPEPAALALAGTIVAVQLALGIATWDRRPSETATIEAGASAESFAAAIPPGAVVYWQDSPLRSWFLLRRANYFSGAQGAGVAFSRDGALEFVRRARRLAPLGVGDGDMSLAVRQKTLYGPLPFAGLVHLCHDPALDFAILAQTFPEAPVAVWREDGPGRDWLLFDCRRIRANHPDSMGEAMQ